MKPTREVIRTAAELQAVAIGSGADVISIDMFDTLVYRRCASPISVFRIQYDTIAALLPATVDCERWVALRTTHEGRIARRALPDEIRVDEIYAAIAADLSLDSATTAVLEAAELDAEMAVIRPCLEVVDALRQLRSMGKQIVINTDIYLPADFIAKVLRTMLAFDFLLLCSSETRKPKRSGLAYVELERMFPSESIVHFGDNPHSDVRMAEGTRIASHLVRWSRSEFIERNELFVRYLTRLRIDEFSTPVDRQISPGIDGCRAEVAWRWAVILADFLRAADAYVKGCDADEVWFLSRDCEAIFEALNSTQKMFAGARRKYVFSSRMASYPIAATIDPDTFARWTGRQPVEADVEEGSALIDAYRSLPSAGSKRLVMIDIGWKGRVQLALQMAIPHMTVSGFYFSLDPKCEADTRRKSATFVDWDESIVSQVGAEALSGYQGASCSGYAANSAGGWVPMFRPFDGDTCPKNYSENLVRYLSEFLANCDVGHSESTSDARRAAIRSVLMYPDHITAAAFKDWQIEAEVGAGVRGALVEGGSARLKDRVLGRARDGNLWPQLGVWSTGRSPTTIWLLQSLIDVRKRLIRATRFVLGMQASAKFAKSV